MFLGFWLTDSSKESALIVDTKCDLVGFFSIHANVLFRTLVEINVTAAVERWMLSI